MKINVPLFAGLVAVCFFLIISYQKVKKTKSITKQFETVKIHEANLQSGDVLLCNDHRGMGPVFGFFLGSIVNHVGIVYRNPTTNHIYILEMMIAGIRMIPLYAFLKYYKGNIYARKLSPCVTSQQQKKFDDYLRKHWVDKYDYGMISHVFNRMTISSFLPVKSSNPYEHHTCAQFIFKILQEVGVLIDNEEYKIETLPQDFMTCKQKLPLEKGYSFGPEIHIIL